MASRSVFQFHGCLRRGGPKRYPTQTAYTNQPSCEIKLSEPPDSISWSCGSATHIGKPPVQNPKTKLIHTYLVGLQAYLDKRKARFPITFFTFDAKHIPMSVIFGDTLKPSTQLGNADPKEINTASRSSTISSV